MVYPSVSPVVQITASAGQTNFAGPFKLFETSDVTVYLTPAGQTPDPAIDLLTEGVDYTITISGDGLTFTMTLIVAATLNDVITMELDIANSRTTDFQVGGTFTSTALNLQLDKITALISQTDSTLHRRGLLYEVTDQLDDGNTTIPKLEPNEIWQANAAGNIAAAECINETCSTLRSQLASETIAAPGTDNVGYNDGYYGGGLTLTETLDAIRPSNRIFTTTGTANSYILTSPITAKTLLEPGDTMVIQIHQTNVDGAVTFDLDGIGATSVVNNINRDFTAKELVANTLYQFVYDGTKFRLLSQYRSADDQLQNNYFSGFTLSNNAADSAHDIDIASGACKDSTNLIDIVFRESFTKQLDAVWASGSGNGGRASAVALVADSAYGLFAIMGTDGVIDFGFDTSATAANLLSDSGFTYYQYIGTVNTDGSANIHQFIQTGRTFMFKTPILDYAVTNPGAAAVLSSLSVPALKKVMAHFNIGLTLGAATASLLYLSDPDSVDVAPSLSASPLANLLVYPSHTGLVMCDAITSNQQIRHRLSYSDASTECYIVTKGYTDSIGS